MNQHIANLDIQGIARHNVVRSLLYFQDGAQTKIFCYNLRQFIGDPSYSLRSG